VEVARRIFPTRRYLRHAQALGVGGGSGDSRALAAVVRALATAASGDAVVVLVSERAAAMMSDSSQVVALELVRAHESLPAASCGAVEDEQAKVARSRSLARM
jgi:hypothetical protein